MERPRPSEPLDGPAWMHDGTEGFFAEVDRVGRRIEPELFRMLQRFRRVRVRLVVEVALLVPAVVLTALIPNLGQIMLATTIAILAGYDALLLLHLRRRIAEAWSDLARGTAD